MAEKAHEEVAETAPDPEEDDLDDLDDVLDEFQAPSASSKPAPKASTSTSSSTAPAASGPGRPPPTTTGKDAPPLPSSTKEEADFAAQLQAGMSNLMSELDSNPDMQKQFEQMMQELIAAGAAPTDEEAGQHLAEAAKTAPDAPAPSISAKEAKPSSSAKPASTSTKTAPPAAAQDDFSSTIRRTMERMQQSDAAAASTTTPADNLSEDQLLAQMMRELQQSGGADSLGEGEGGEDFNKMLLSMMTQLSNKEILYEPMKELHTKFPAWMEEHAETCGKEDLERYREQKVLVGEIVGRFERRGYRDEDEGDRSFIVERMQKMQAAGSPPPDLVGDMSSAQDALGDLDAGCPTQ